MRLVRLRAPGGLQNLKLLEEDHPKPRPGELLVRIRASSLNFRDDWVALGKIPCADGRIPLSDGAGEVSAVGDDVDEFKVADTVVSTFWPYWLGGEMTPATKRDIPGESVDGYAREYVCMPAHAFAKAPAGYTHVEAATLTCAGVTAWRGLVVCGQVKPGDTVLILGTGGVSLFALQFADAAGGGVWPRKPTVEVTSASVAGDSGFESLTAHQIRTVAPLGCAVLEEVMVGRRVQAANRCARSLADLTRRVDQLAVVLEAARVAVRTCRGDREV